MKPGDYVAFSTPIGNVRGFVLETCDLGAKVYLDEPGDHVAFAATDALRFAEDDAWNDALDAELQEQALAILDGSARRRDMKRFARRVLRMMASNVANVIPLGWTASRPYDGRALTTTQVNLTTVAEALNVDITFADSVTTKAAVLAAGVNEALKKAAEPGWAALNTLCAHLADVAPMVGLQLDGVAGVEWGRRFANRIREMARLVEQAGKTEAHATMTERALTDEGKALDEVVRERDELRRSLSVAHGANRTYSDQLDKYDETFRVIRADLRTACLALGLDAAVSPLDMAKALSAHATRTCVTTEPCQPIAEMAVIIDDDSQAPPSDADDAPEDDEPAHPEIMITKGDHAGKHALAIGPAQWSTHVRVRLDSGHEVAVLRADCEPRDALPPHTGTPRKKRTRREEPDDEVLERVAAELAEPKRNGQIAASLGLPEYLVEKALAKLAEQGRAKAPTTRGLGALWSAA